MTSIRKHLTYANVTATLALFLAIGGGMAWAIGKNTVRSKHIVNGQVKSADLRNNNVKGVDLRDGSVSAADLGTDSVGADELALNAVESAHVVTNGIGASEIAQNAVGSSELATNSVARTNVQPGAVGSNEIGTDAIDADHISQARVEIVSDPTPTTITDGPSSGPATGDSTATCPMNSLLLGGYARWTSISHPDLNLVAIREIVPAADPGDPFPRQVRVRGELDRNSASPGNSTAALEAMAICLRT